MDGAAPRITVAICTFNRSASLRRTLASLMAMDPVPPGDWDVLVMDNNSNDDTRTVVAEVAATSQVPVTYAFEPRQGKAHALNHASDLARGEYILWTDDDVVVGRSWLSAYRAAIDRMPGAVLLGGAIRPQFEQGPPGWLAAALERVSGAYALLDLGPDVVPLRANGPYVPFGANMAVRTLEQRRFRYDPKFGPGSPLGILGDDTILARALLDAGHPGWWVPSAEVQHVIPVTRQTTAYLRRWYDAYGYLTELLASERGERQDPAMVGWLRRTLLFAELRYVGGRLTGSPARWASALAEAAFLRGRLRYRRSAPVSPA